jgi:exfoliative toxin A/B
MLLMILSAALAQCNIPGVPIIAGALFRAAVILHALHIAFFTFCHVITGFKKETFVPSWFVTYNGIMVSTVAGPGLIPAFSRIVLYYGLAAYFIVIPLMVIRLAKYPADPSLLHTKAIVLAPVSLCLVSYLNVEPAPSAALVLALYGMLLLSLLYILLKIPRFFSVPFTPGFAGLTFPMAIGTMASFRMAGWLRGAGQEGWGAIVQNIAGIQLYLTTAIIAFVLFNFLRSGHARIARVKPV